SWLSVSGKNMPSSANAENENRLTKSKTGSSSTPRREYFEVIKVVLPLLLIESRICDVTRRLSLLKAGRGGRHFPFLLLLCELRVSVVRLCQQEFTTGGTKNTERGGITSLIPAGTSEDQRVDC